MGLCGGPIPIGNLAFIAPVDPVSPPSAMAFPLRKAAAAGALIGAVMKEMRGHACWDCHRDVPHTRSRSEVSTPNAPVPMPDTNVPDWLNTAMEGK